MCYGNLDPKYAMRDIDACVKHLSFEPDATKRNAYWVQAGFMIASTARRIVHALVAAAAIAMTGCVTTEPENTSSADSVLTKDTAPLLFAAAMAGTVARECRAEFRLNTAAQDSFMEQVWEQRDAEVARGVKLLTKAEKERLFEGFFEDYVEPRAGVGGSPAFWCVFGRAEVSEGTQTGKLLILK